MDHDIYFHVDKYKEACGTNASVKQLSRAGGRHHIDTGMILINVKKIIRNDHGALQRLPDFNARFNLVVSHEIIHRILTRMFDEDVSHTLDQLTVKYWRDEDIDINTNQYLL